MLTEGVVVVVDGVLRSGAEGHVSALDRGLAHGDGCFETLRVHAGVPFDWPAHAARLGASCAYLGISFDRGRVDADVQTALDASSGTDASLRVTITRGRRGPGLDTRAPGAPTRVVVLAPYLETSCLAQRLVTRIAPVDRRAAQFKLTSYARSVVGRRAAEDANGDDALFVDEQGAVLEASAANVFVVRAGALRTPPIALGVLPGITRGHVLALAREQGLVATEELLFASDLYAADEIFLTSSVRGLVPVASVDGVVVRSGAPGPTTHLLSAELQARVASLTSAAVSAKRLA